MTQRLILNSGGEKATVHADLADAAVGYLRDMAVARDGNAYVTSFDADAAGPDGFASVRVLLATPDGKVRSVADQYGAPERIDDHKCARSADRGDARQSRDRLPDGECWRAAASKGVRKL